MPKQQTAFTHPEFSLISKTVGPQKTSLYISGTEGARNIARLSELGITTVFNCAVNLDINYVGDAKLGAEPGKCAAGCATIRTYKVGLVDGPGNPDNMLLGAYYLLASALNQTIPDKPSYPVRAQGNVLVHCRGGRSRSVALVALFLHLTEPEAYPTLDAAISHVRAARELHPQEWGSAPKQVLIDAAQRAVQVVAGQNGDMLGSRQ